MPDGTAFAGLLVARWWAKRTFSCPCYRSSYSLHRTARTSHQFHSCACIVAPMPLPWTGPYSCPPCPPNILVMPGSHTRPTTSYTLRLPRTFARGTFPRARTRACARRANAARHAATAWWACGHFTRDTRAHCAHCRLPHFVLRCFSTLQRPVLHAPTLPLGFTNARCDNRVGDTRFAALYVCSVERLTDAFRDVIRRCAPGVVRFCCMVSRHAYPSPPPCRAYHTFWFFTPPITPMTFSRLDPSSMDRHMPHWT